MGHSPRLAAQVVSSYTPGDAQVPYGFTEHFLLPAAVLRLCGFGGMGVAFQLGFLVPSVTGQLWEHLRRSLCPPWVGPCGGVEPVFGDMGEGVSCDPACSGRRGVCELSAWGCCVYDPVSDRCVQRGVSGPGLGVFGAPSLQELASGLEAWEAPFLPTNPSPLQHWPGVGGACATRT